ncbi:growth factor receptor-bound protein 14 isoform X2 [Andrena cerasifolii]|uniref:growth factor receptor-bound protein 14 isoform X2 n=1 Tax=Andrena cerasifolii TaxID=2819439 RepID=UPI004037C524
MLADQRLSVCRRTVDMVGKFTFMTTTTFEDVDPDRTKTVEDQSPSQAYLGCPREPTSDAVESQTTEGISKNLTVSTTATTMQENQHVETTADRRSYSVAFHRNRAELGSYSTSAREKETSVRTWLSQVRRRCLNIRGWMPKMCSCVETNPAFSGRAAARVGNYQRLGSRPNELGFHRQQPTPGTSYDDDTDEYYDESADGDAKQAEELCFYFDDNTCNTLLVEKNLRAIDLCQLLKVKRNVSGISWSIVETWPELGIERTLEDHEDILSVHKEMKLFTSRHLRKFIFRADVLKYQLFRKHNDFTAENTVTSIVNGPGETGGKLIDAESALRDSESDCFVTFQTNLLHDDTECPQIFSLAWVRNGYYDVWRKVYLLLRDRMLYVSNKVQGSVPKRPPRDDQLIAFAHLSDYELYRITTAKSRFNSPFEWGICLRRSCNTEAENTVSSESGLKIVTFHTEKSYVFWLTAMRLAKYGKQLRENYKAFKNRQCEQTNGEHQKEQYANVHNEPIRSRVAMDFTGSVGRIVEDPKEAKDIAESEGMNWRRTWRPFSRPAAQPSCGMVRFHGLDDGVHVLEPWFHRGLKRDIAAGIIRDHGTADGVFLVRDSKSNVGAYVLTYKFSEKVFHVQIQPVFDERCNCWLYTIDKGITKFYDLLQLIVFYQLNAGCLPTRLTHYVQNGIAAPAPRSEDGGASPPLSEPCVRFSAIPTVIANTTNCSSHRSI